MPPGSSGASSPHSAREPVFEKTDIADSLYDLVVSEQGGGLPVTFYFDNGGEYNDVAKAIADFPELSGLISGRGHIRAQPYNGAAKPIEGTFRILEQNYFRFLPGWIGGDRSNKKNAASR